LADELIRNTVRLCLLYYAITVSLMLLLQPADWTAYSTRGATTRWFWTLAWAAFMVHLVMAFHHAHDWSHAAAVKHTEDVSGFGPGIYFSHFFTLVWTADVLFWWLCPLRYARRSRWIDRMLHGFMLFMIFNATVVFETGLIRWASIAFLTALASVWILAKGRRFERERQSL
jgi:hypothetical protein